MISIVKIIEETIRNRPKDERRQYIGASQIGHKCDRAIWYAFNGFEKECDSVKMQKVYDAGRIFENLILDYIIAGGIIVEGIERACEDEEIPMFRGHMDGVLMLPNQDPIVLELKTSKASSFARFVQHGLMAWAPQYYDQLQSYMGMTGYKNGVLVAINKDSSELHEEWVKFDEIHYASIKEKVKRIINASETPEKINRSPLFYVCQMCNFRRVCHV